MNILFIVPPKVGSDLPPMGIMYIASLLEKEGHDVHILDCSLYDMDFDDLKWAVHYESLMLNRIDVVGVSSTTLTIAYSLMVLEIVKKYSDRIITVLGGNHATACPEVLKNWQVDFLVRGEGENTFLELIKKLDGFGGLPLVDYKNMDYLKIKGLSWKNGKNLLHNDPRERIENLDELPYPARHLVEIKRYKGSVLPLKLPETHVMTSRGCPYNCTFCYKGIFGHKTTFRDPIKVVDEMEYVKKEYGVKAIVFVDDTLNLKREFFNTLLDEIIKRKLKLKLKAQLRVNEKMIDLGTLKKAKKAGFYLIMFGVESGNQEILDKIKKKITLEEVDRAVRLTKKVGLKAVGYFMLGNQGETKETINDTIEFAKSVPFDFIQCTIAMPYPGTEFYRICEENEWLKVVNWEEKEFLTYKDCMVERLGLSSEFLESELKRFYKEFYMRKKYMISKIFDALKSWSNFKFYWKGFRQFRRAEHD